MRLVACLTMRPSYTRPCGLTSVDEVAMTKGGDGGALPPPQVGNSSRRPTVFWGTMRGRRLMRASSRAFER
jgi:hypothetical protein